MIKIRFIGFPKQNDADLHMQSQCLFETMLPSAPEFGEVVLVNENEYKVKRRRWDFESDFNNGESLIGTKNVSAQLNVYLVFND